MLVGSFVPLTWATPKESKADASKRLPDKIGSFRAQGAASKSDQAEVKELGDVSGPTAQRVYASSNAKRFRVSLTTTSSDSGAYSLLTSCDGNQDIQLNFIGTAGVVSPGSICFFKGRNFVKIEEIAPRGTHEEEIVSLARELAPKLDSGINDIPVLIKHLPDWEKVMPHARYAVSLGALKKLLSNQLILDSVSFEGGAEAVLANYDAGKLLLIEFNTPQIATDNDRRITTKLQELRNQGQPLPTTYRRIGNYGVFVFEAPSLDAANQLIDNVKYQQVVQWLGENPFLYEEATREFAETTLGVFVNVVKASGLALVSCFALGGFVGGLLFIRRRSQQRTMEAYSDAGGMVRLNLDEMTPESDPPRLLGRGN